MVLNDNTEILKPGHVNDSQHVFVHGHYYITAFANRQPAIDDWTKTPKLLLHQYNHDTVQHVRTVKRKMILYPEPLRPNEPTYHLPIDFDTPNIIQRVQVPMWPTPGDIVSIQGRAEAVWYGRVTHVYTERRKVKVTWVRGKTWLPTHYKRRRYCPL